LSQLQDNLGALQMTSKLTPEILERIDAIAKPLAT
jgi:aryl-alcohol dehydrogenase-like predicted oxidoreductase